MSRKWGTHITLGLAVLVSSGPSVFAQAIDEAKAKELIAEAVSKVETELGNKITASENRLMAAINNLTPQPPAAQTAAAQTAAAQTAAMAAAIAAAQATTVQNNASTANDFNKYFQAAFAHAKRCDDLERFRKVMQNLAGTGNSNDCCNQFLGLGAPCDYSDGKGGIDPIKLFNCEFKRLEEAEKLARFRKIFKGIVTGSGCKDDCKSECKTSGVSYSSSNYCPPGWAPVTIEPGPPPYWRYVNCD